MIASSPSEFESLGSSSSRVSARREGMAKAVDAFFESLDALRSCALASSRACFSSSEARFPGSKFCMRKDDCTTGRLRATSLVGSDKVNMFLALSPPHAIPGKDRQLTNTRQIEQSKSSAR